MERRGSKNVNNRLSAKIERQGLEEQLACTQASSYFGNCSPDESLQRHRGQDIASPVTIVVQSIEQLFQDYLMTTPPETRYMRQTSQAE